MSPETLQIPDSPPVLSNGKVHKKVHIETDINTDLPETHICHGLRVKNAVTNQNCQLQPLFHTAHTYCVDKLSKF